MSECLFFTVLTSYPTISHLKSRNNVHLRSNCVQWCLVHPTQLVLTSYPTIFHLKSRNNVHLRFNCVHVYFCNLSMKLNVPPLVATSLLNHFEDFVKSPLSFNTSVTDPFSVLTDSHLQELPDPETTWEQTLSIYPFYIPTDSHLQEMSDPGTTWEQTLFIFSFSSYQLPLTGTAGSWNNLRTNTLHILVLCSYWLPLTGTARSWNNLRTNTLHIQQEIFWRSFNH